jgi:hypothetical protein
MFLFFKIEWPLIKIFKTNLGDKEHMKVHFIMLRDILGGIYSDKNKSHQYQQNKTFSAKYFGV